jgi:hypothetical protein
VRWAPSGVGGGGGGETQTSDLYFIRHGLCVIVPPLEIKGPFGLAFSFLAYLLMCSFLNPPFLISMIVDHQIVILSINNKFQIYYIIFFKCTLHFNQKRACTLSLGSQ